MLKMPNEMQSSDTKFAEEVLKFNKSFQQLKFDIAITKNVNSSFFYIFDLFFRQNLFVCKYHAPSCQEFFLNSHWLSFIVC